MQNVGMRTTMKMQSQLPVGPQAISRHSPEGVVIQGQTYRESILAPWSGPPVPWSANTVEALDEAAMAQIVALAPEVVLIGTGGKQKFIHPRITQSLMQARIGFECMDTPSACRTFNVLLHEDRKVLAALMFDPSS